jgi:hypothetical protein
MAAQHLVQKTTLPNSRQLTIVLNHLNSNLIEVPKQAYGDTHLNHHMAARADVKEKVVETQVGKHMKLSPKTKVTYAPRILKPATNKHQISVQERKCRNLTKINITRWAQSMNQEQSRCNYNFEMIVLIKLLSMRSLQVS